MITVIRDGQGDLWINLGASRWALASDLEQGLAFGQRYSFSLDEIEKDFGPHEVVVEIGE